MRRQSAQPKLLERFAEQDGGGFAGASGGILLFAAVDQAVEESAGGDDDGLSADGAAVAEADAETRALRCRALRWRRLENRKVVLDCVRLLPHFARLMTGLWRGGILQMDRH